jgi:hypothetical protein
VWRPLTGPWRGLPALLAVGALVASAGCRGRASLLIPFDSGSPAPPPPAEEPREVHFTFTAPDEVTFDWRGTDATLRVWAKNVPPLTVEARHPNPLPFSSGGPWQEAVAGGLLPGVEYQYEVGNPVRPVPLAFRAPPARGAAGFSFVAVGDVGATSDWPAATDVHRLIRLSDPAFVLMLGDLAYGDIRSQAAVDRHFDDVMVWSRRSAYMPVWGNHEWEEPKGDDLRNYKGRFALPHAAASPGAPAAGCCGEDWYWFDFGAVRFVIYPEPYTADTWTDWAARAEPLFAAAEGDAALGFVVTAGHRPAYSSGHHGGEAQLRAILDGFGKKFSKYVLNLSGHSHVYERTRPQAHVVHVTAGIGGGALEHAATSCLWASCRPPPFSAYRAIHHGFVRLTADPTALKLAAICGPSAGTNDDVRCAEGEIFDEIAIPTGGSPPIAVSPRRVQSSALAH